MASHLRKSTTFIKNLKWKFKNMKEYNNLKYSDDFKTCYGFCDNKKYNVLNNEIILHENTQAIKSKAFIDENNIEKIIFNEKLEYIGAEAFKNSSVKDINLSNVRIGFNAFLGCKELKNVKLYNCLIQNSAFENSNIEYFETNSEIISQNCFFNAYIENIKLLNGVKIIEESAFEEAKFKNKTLYLPMGLEELKEHCFTFINLEQIFVNDDLKTADVAIIEPFGNETLFIINKRLEEKHFFKWAKTKVMDLDILINENKSFKEINDFYKNKSENTR